MRACRGSWGLSAAVVVVFAGPVMAVVVFVFVMFVVAVAFVGFVVVMMVVAMAAGRRGWRRTIVGHSACGSYVFDYCAIGAGCYIEPRNRNYDTGTGCHYW